MKKKRVYFVVRVIVIIILVIVTCILPSKIAEKNLDNIFD